VAEAPQNIILPHDDDAERAVLGAMLLELDAIGAVAELLAENDFYTRAHRIIFKAILILYNQGTTPEQFTLCEELRKENLLAEAGDVPYVASLNTVVPTTANLSYYIKVVSDTSIRRGLIRLAYDTITTAQNLSIDAREALDKTEQRLFELNDTRKTIRYREMKQIMNEVIERAEEANRTKNQLRGISSGLQALDNLTSGFQKEDLIIIGARPSQGKTALALSFAKHSAFRMGIPTAFFTLEMSDLAIAQRLLSAEAGINSRYIMSGMFDAQRDGPRLVEASARMAGAPLYIVDVPNMKLLELRSQARRLRQRQKIEIMYVDYLGLISSDLNMGFQARHEMIGEISRSLKSLARELKIPIIVLSQLNREAAKDDTKGPNISQIRDSGSVEQDADLVMMLHRSDKMEKESKEKGLSGIVTDLIIAKQRNGPTGMVKLLFQQQYTLFVAFEGGE
jgi:replicative DNA helicase